MAFLCFACGTGMGALWKSGERIFGEAGGQSRSRSRGEGGNGEAGKNSAQYRRYTKSPAIMGYRLTAVKIATPASEITQRRR